MRNDRLYLADILEAIERIDRYTVAGMDGFDGDELVQTWVVRHLEIIGEAVRSLSPEVKARHPEVPWVVIGRLRNILAHHYFDVDLTTIRAIVTNDLPELKRELEPVLAEFRSQRGRVGVDQQS